MIEILATPCNGKIECQDGRDELGCKDTQFYLICTAVVISTVCVTFAILVIVWNREDLSDWSGPEVEALTEVSFKILHQTPTMQVMVAKILAREEDDMDEKLVELYNFEFSHHSRDKTEALICIKVQYHSFN